MLRIPYSKRAKMYGYIIWPSTTDADIKKILGLKEEVRLIFNDIDLGIKRIDWKSRRISIGYKHTRYSTVEYKEVHIQFVSPNKLLAKLV